MATASQPQTIEQYLQSGNIEPEIALKIALAATERALAEKATAEARVNEQLSQAKEMADVHFGPEGIQADNAAALWRIARLFAQSDLVPMHFQGKPANCFIALQMANRCKVDPFAFMQRLYVVHGRPALETQLAIALANKAGVFKQRITFEITGEDDDKECVAMAILADSGQVVKMKITVKMAKQMGWWDKKGSLWPMMTDLFLQYRSALWLIRTYAPEVMMGLQTSDEARDVEPRGDSPEVATLDSPKSLDGLTKRWTGASERSPFPENGNSLDVGHNPSLPDEVIPGQVEQAIQPAEEPAPAEHPPAQQSQQAEPAKTQPAPATAPIDDGAQLPDALVDRLAATETLGQVNSLEVTALAEYKLNPAQLRALKPAAEMQRELIRSRRGGKETQKELGSK